jgi:hypothetical protein
MSNSRDFFLEKIKEALIGTKDGDDLFRVYLIFNRILKNENGNATPRQIIAFINELTGMYVLHQGRFSLPTVALYIAYQDELEANPYILNEQSCIDERLRSLVADADLEQNLAAMIFNVEPSLAIQLLLDNKIKQAACGDASDLLEIAKAPSFDLRVNEVVQDNVAEWQNSGEIGVVIRNFAELGPKYVGDAKKHFSKILVESIGDISSVSLIESKYSPLLMAYDLAVPAQLPDLTRNLVEAGLASLEETALATAQGSDWAHFVGDIHRRLELQGHPGVLKNALSAISLPDTPGFLFGLASSVRGEQLNLKVFDPPRPDLSVNKKEFEVLAIESPEAARRAFAEFKSLAILKDENWISIGQALLEQLAIDGVDDAEDYQSQLNLLAEIVTFVASSKRSDMDIKQLFGNVQFYQNLRANIADESDAVLGSAIFLALHEFGSKGLSVPSRVAANGTRVSDASDEFGWFQGLLKGETELVEGQYEQIASLGKRAFVISTWLDIASATPDDQLLRSILCSAFVSGDLPWTNLSVLLKHFDYLKIALGDNMLPMINRYQERITDKDIQNVKLEDCSVDLVRDVFEVSGVRWRAFHDRIGDLLNAVPAHDWVNHLAAGDHHARILVEKLSTSGIVFADFSFREKYTEFLLNILADRVELQDATLHYDLLLNAIDKNFHPDIFRKLREDLRDVNAKSLATAINAFPKTISQMIGVGDRLSAAEKDNVIRYVLCPALEGCNRVAIGYFETLGRAKVRDFIKQSEESTREKLEGAWSVFSRDAKEWNWRRQIGELIHGKKKAKSFFDLILGTSQTAEEGEDA